MTVTESVHIFSLEYKAQDADVYHSQLWEFVADRLNSGMVGNFSSSGWYLLLYFSFLEIVFLDGTECYGSFS